MPADKGARSWRLRVVQLAVVLVGICLLAGCRFPTTVYGQLALKPGQDGDVRLARVELHDSVAWDSAPLYAIVPESGGSFFRASFEFPAVAPGPYYLLAWQDKDADGKVSDGDMTGVYGGPHEPGSPGKPVMVHEDWTVDAGEIEMARYAVLEVAAAGQRSQSGETTGFIYTANYDVTLASLTITFPGQPAMPDPSAPGPKLADSTYRSDGWRMGGPMPTGLHQLEFRGLLDDDSFDIRVAVPVE
ncbi:MAG: hypothetical protein NTX53_08355 [candidate division WOR-3 bacterium]|nr:hypothetical protein [candidate division WOR-3 bacterium]